MLDVIGVMTNQVASSTTLDESPGAGDDSWLAVSVSGITSPSAVYYINLRDPQQQVQVGSCDLLTALPLLPIMFNVTFSSLRPPALPPLLPSLPSLPLDQGGGVGDTLSYEPLSYISQHQLCHMWR